MKTLIAALAGMVWLSLLAGCNTIAGVGKDISSAGTSIENAANSNKKKQ
ncbi:MAG: entericidin A/B family lipoprotein [Rubrivivax sp.]